MAHMGILVKQLEALRLWGYKDKLNGRVIIFWSVPLLEDKKPVWNYAPLNYLLFCEAKKP